MSVRASSHVEDSSEKGRTAQTHMSSSLGAESHIACMRSWFMQALPATLGNLIQIERLREMNMIHDWNEVDLGNVLYNGHSYVEY